MGKVMKIARRSLIVGSAVVAGGVAFGYYQVKKPLANPLKDGLQEDEAAITPWVLIDPDGVTLITPHVDLGQGTVNMQALLLAEELDLEFGEFKVNFGKPAAAYYNQGFGDEGVPFMSTDRSGKAQMMRGVMNSVSKLMGLQATGGSTSATDSFDKLRRAGAVARETLKAAAAAQSGFSRAELKTKNGKVLLPNGQSIAYTELVALAGKIEPVNDVELRKPDQWRLIGKPNQRLDIVAKSTGTQLYGIDLEFEGMLHATVKLNPRKGGALISYDARAAEKMRGVKRILPVTGGVAVVADNSWRAMKAANAIVFDWGEAPYPAEMAEHWQIVGESFTEERLDNEWRHDGDVDTSLNEATSVLNVEYKAPYVAHQPLEPLSAVALVTDDQADLWTATQAPRFAQDDVAKISGLDKKNVFVHNQFAGGSFGHRLEHEYLILATEIATAMKGTPISLFYSREDDFALDYPRQLGMARMRGVVSGHKIETASLDIASLSAVGSQMSRRNIAVPGADKQLAAGAWNLPYAIPNFRMRAYRVPELAPTSSWRSVGASSNGFFADGFIDELIHEAGMDALEGRIMMVSDPVARGVLEAVGELSNWGSELGVNRGRGVAFVTSFGTPTAEVIEVTNTPNGIKIDKVFVVADVGQIIDPINFDNHVKGGVVWALGHAMNCEITYSDGMAQQHNFHEHEAMRLYQCPDIIVKGLENGDIVRGIGEPPVPPAAPALANAIFSATGLRLREMPFNKHIRFV